MLGVILRCWCLCQQLGDEAWPARDGAQAELDRCGVYALPALLWHQSDADPEVRKRCGELLQPFASRARLLRLDLMAVWVIYGPAFEDDDALLTWFHSCPAEVQAVILVADRRGVIPAYSSLDYLSEPEWWPWRVPLWYERLRRDAQAKGVKP